MQLGARTAIQNVSTLQCVEYSRVEFDVVPRVRFALAALPRWPRLHSLHGSQYKNRGNTMPSTFRVQKLANGNTLLYMRIHQQQL
jgi:hypothetical protein